ncbi:hypothetical protein Tco_1435068 [Tanacetum coccineum]
MLESGGGSVRGGDGDGSELMLVFGEESLDDELDDFRKWMLVKERRHAHGLGFGWKSVNEIDIEGCRSLECHRVVLVVLMFRALAGEVVVDSKVKIAAIDMSFANMLTDKRL